MQVDILADRIVATPATHLERLHLMSLPNSHLRKDGAYWYPMEWTTLGDLVLDFGHGVLTPTAMAAYEAHQREQSYLTSIQLDDGLTAEFILERVPWHAKLYDYQLRGAAWLATARRGILGDEPGLGKTLQAITAVEAKASYPALVITMNSVKLHWQRQIEQWTGSTDVAVAQGSDTGKRLEAIQSDAQWIVINHEMLRSESYRQALLQRPWGTVIVDEAHKLQGRHSQVSEQAAKLRTQNLFMLTGTPVWNKADSIWRLLYLLDPARFRSYWQFVDEYCVVNQTPWGKEVLGINPKMMSKLQSVLGTLVYGRKKVDVLPDLPAKIVTDIPYRLNPSHAKAYNKLKKNLALELEDGSEAYFDSALAVTSKLRTLCNAPTLLGSTGESAKTEIIAELVDELMDDDRKVVIFTWHKDYAKYLTMRLYMWGTVLVTGDQDSIERDRLVQRFRQNEESHLLIATIGSVGTGMELQEATAAIFAEGSYTPAHNLQAEDRLHRIGIHDSPLIYRLWARGTVEEALWSTNDDRIAQADDMLNLRSVMERAMQMEAVSA